ncbi:IQ motif and SEC7 domain-containing protein 3-like [Ursus americanus]|uniref:IQ motif and SEC7 domain-containing protein 3-like n=1 Tax=Ursus americanus TaxID=9643 RepID=UPI001E67D155|nr:IQ motif and SEC7 domain-containing protein 3-like [Ursus americanus]
MASAAEPPGKAAEYLQELTRIVAAQQELLARRRRRIEELERQVARLSRENAGLLERHRRHLAACARRPDPGPGPGPGPQPLGVIPELGGRRDKSEGESSRSVRYVGHQPPHELLASGEWVASMKPCALISL